MPRALQPLEDPQGIRHAGPDLLSLALLDARNHLLMRVAQKPSAAVLRLAVRAASYQENWISCHVQRGRGEACDPEGVRLAGLEPAASEWLQGPAEAPKRLPTLDEVHSFLARTLDVTLELLAVTPAQDAGLVFYRQSLLHEDRLCEAIDEELRVATPSARVVREPLWMPAQRWRLGCAEPGAAGWTPFAERGTHEVALPEYEIDAQPINWAQFAEFAQDGGYDQRPFWTDAGWAWVHATGRRGPAHVAQWRGAVVVQRGQEGPQSLRRAPPGQAVMHVTQHEAQAWCRWAGRRLATEAEWELAASTAASRGFIWGDVLEWTAGSARLWPGAGPVPPGALDAVPLAGQAVLRGASFATRARWRHPKARRFVALDSDTMFCGFRSCAF